MKHLFLSFLYVASTALALSSGGAHASGLNAALPPKPIGAGGYFMAPYNEDANMLRLSQPLFTNKLGDSPYLNGRAALAEGYRTAAITFDYSGTEVFGQIVPPEGITYNVGLAMKYPCITADSNRHGNLVAVYMDDQLTTTLDLGSYFTQQQCEQAVTFTVAYRMTGNHTIRAVKLTEPNGGKVDNTHNNMTFIAFDLVSPAIIQMLPLPAKKLRMEFVGDSITCGYHVNCKAPMDPNVSPYTIESVLEAYPGKTCSNLDAQCHYVSWSGRGMFLNVYVGDSKRVPFMYNYTRATVIDEGDDSLLWDFSYYTPHIVVINLGTNDFNNPTINEEGNVEGYVTAYTNFLWQVASTYGPKDVAIVTVCGPMSYKYCASVEGAIANVTAAHPEMRTPHFVEMKKLLNVNTTCANHPDAAVSVDLAVQLTAYLNEKVIPTIPGF